MRWFKSFFGCLCFLIACIKSSHSSRARAGGAARVRIFRSLRGISAASGSTLQATSRVRPNLILLLAAAVFLLGQLTLSAQELVPDAKVKAPFSELSVKPTTLKYDVNLDKATSETEHFTIKNGGTLALDVDVGVPSSPYYKITTSIPSTILGKGSLTVDVEFVPTGKGTDDGTIAITSSATNGKQDATIHLNGKVTQKKATPTVSATPSGTPTTHPTFSPTPTASVTATPTPTVTTTISPSPTPRASPTVTATVTATPTVTVNVSATPTVSRTPTVTATVSATPTVSGTPTVAATPTVTATVSATPTVSETPTATATPAITVNNLSDPARTSGNGFCTLREAIDNANAMGDTSGGDCAPGTSTGNEMIRFSVSGTITLNSALPSISTSSGSSLTIDGTGQTITVDGANLYPVLETEVGATLNLNLLTIAHGNGNGVYDDEGTLTVTNSTFSNNSGGAVENRGRHADGHRQHLLLQLGTLRRRHR